MIWRETETSEILESTEDKRLDFQAVLSGKAARHSHESGRETSAELVDAQVVGGLNADLPRWCAVNVGRLGIGDGAVLDPPSAIHDHEGVSDP